MSDIDMAPSGCASNAEEQQSGFEDIKTARRGNNMLYTVLTLRRQ
jgi:hypothetical protein